MYVDSTGNPQAVTGGSWTHTANQFFYTHSVAAPVTNLSNKYVYIEVVGEDAVAASGYTATLTWRQL